MPIQAACPKCRTGYPVADSMLGKQVRCNQCQTVFAVQRPEARKAAIQCPCPACRKPYQFPSDKVGTTVRCAACQKVFVVSQAAPIRPGAPPAVPPRVTPFQGVCPVCHATYSFPASQLGQKVRCKCEAIFVARAAPIPVVPKPLPVAAVVKTDGAARGRRFAAAASRSVASVLGKLKRILLALPLRGRNRRRWLIGAGAIVVATAIIAIIIASGAKEDAAPKDGEHLASAKDGAAESNGDKDDPEDESGPSDGPLPPPVLAKVKKATVYLRVTYPDGSIGQGSGFFGLEPGIVLTNAHVLGMLEPDGRLPRNIDVVLHSGTAKERKLAGEVLGVDRSSDLAVVRVKGENLPERLRVRSAKTLSETQTVYVIGFPLGDQLGKNVSVRKSSVSALRTDDFGTLNKVQMEGGMDPGNSGGPVVNTRGIVIGVAVSKILATQLNFAVPGDYVRVIINGRLTTFSTGQPFKDGSDIKVPITMTMLDPLKRVKKVALEYWTGNPGKPRPATAERPKPEAGDGPVQSLDLAYEKGEAKGAVAMPTLSAGKVYWTRPMYVDGTGTTKRVSANTYVPPPLIERKPALLVLKHITATRPLTLASSSAFRMVVAGEAHEMRTNMESHFRESTTLVNPDGSAVMGLGYTRLKVGVIIDKKPAPSPKIEQITRDSVSVETTLMVDQRGKIHWKRSDSRHVPDTSRAAVKEMHEQVETSLEAIAIQLPGEMTEPGRRWTTHAPLAMGAGGPAARAMMRLTYTYLGTRVREGREEAYIEIAGQVRGPQGRALQVGGKVTGMGALDLETGQISLAKVTVNVDLDMRFEDRKAKANGILEVNLRRGVVAAKAGR